ncbi:MAG: hypothetical protein JWN77_596 [Frankiales bacterium]|nr:hypothetical protein [Frankiales bacterium]
MPRFSGAVTPVDPLAVSAVVPLRLPVQRASDAPFPRCSRARDVQAACEGLADDLVALGFDLPSVYLLNGERLRCRSARGYFQVVDGFPAGVGVIGRTIASGVPTLIEDIDEAPEFIAAIPGLRSEACVPVLSGGRPVGAVNVESRSPLDRALMRQVQQAADVISRRIFELGGIPAPSQAHRLGSIALAMTRAAGALEIEQLATASAVELSGIPTAAVIHLRRRGATVTAACGPLAETLRAWDAQELAVMAGWVSAGTSSHFPGGEDVPPEYAFLSAAGVRAMSVHPLVVAGRLSGLLVLAGEEPVGFSAEMVEVLEILAAQTAASLGVVTAMAELARRADLDGLTGLRNAASFAADLAAGHWPGRPALVLIDVDDFKAVNDGYGHLAGDRLLQSLAVELTAVLRDGDRLYRIGGDEFAAVVGTAGTDDLSALTGRLLQAARRVRTTVSVGTAALDAEHPDRTRIAADAALYGAKAAGRDQARHA